MSDEHGDVLTRLGLPSAATIIGIVFLFWPVLVWHGEHDGTMVFNWTTVAAVGIWWGSLAVLIGLIAAAARSGRNERTGR